MAERLKPAVVSLDSVTPYEKDEAPTKVKVARLVTRERCGGNLLVGHCWMDPGDKTNVWSVHDEDDTTPDEHWYGPLEETYYVLTGKLRLTWDEGEFELGPDDAVYLAAGWRYQLENIGDDQARLIYGLYPSPE
jgi:mannose-6-phosphate isomerase-like protein (cupin superfamily)